MTPPSWVRSRSGSRHTISSGVERSVAVSRTWVGLPMATRSRRAHALGSKGPFVRSRT